MKNDLFGASEEVILQLISAKCTEAIYLTKAQLQYLDFVVNRLFMKLKKINSMQTVELCRVQFNFDLPTVILARTRFMRFMNKAYSQFE